MNHRSIPVNSEEQSCETQKSTWNFEHPLLKALEERGFLYQLTAPKDLDKKLQEGPLTAYLGCDVTAPSLHVGNLLGLMVVRWMKFFDQRVLLLLGEATTKIGDPSGKDEQRKLLDQDTILRNTQGIRQCYERVCGDNIPIVNNKDWLDSLGYIDFLRDIGVHFSINRMLSFDSVKNRLDRQQSLSFIEFNYILLQSYDFLHLFQQENCVVQLGGSDQWGNIVSGVDLIGKITGQQAFGVTWPLMTTSSGQKMGKSAQGALWLDPNLCSPYQYWQFWRNVQDEDVCRFLRLYTMLPMELIGSFEQKEGKELDEGKILLANEATALLHGQDVLPSIHKAISYVFLGECPEDSSSSDVLKELWTTLPHVVISEKEWKEGKRLCEILEELSLVKSRKEGRDRLKANSVMVDHCLVEDELAVLPYDPSLSYEAFQNKEDSFLSIPGDSSFQLIKIFLLTFGGKKHSLIGIAKETL